MSVTEEFLRMLVEIKGAQALPDLQKALADVGKEQANLKALYDQSAISEEKLEKETRRLAASNVALKNSIDQIENGIGKTTNKMAGLGQASLQTSYAVQDLAQGGFGGVLNNIPGIIMALGGGPGLAGVIGGVGVAFLLLKPKIEAATKAFGEFFKEVDLSKTSIETLEARIKELTDKPIKLTVDRKEIEAETEHMESLKKDKAAAEAFAAGKSEAQAEAGKRVGKAIIETGEAPQIKREFEAQRFGELAAADKRVRTPEQIKALAEAREAADAAEDLRAVIPANIRRNAAQLKETSDAVTKQLREQATLEIGNLKREAESGTNQEARLQLVERLRTAGRVGLAEQIRGITPESVKAEEAAAAEKKARDKTEAAEKKARDETEAAEKKAVQDLMAKLGEDLTDRITSNLAKGYTRENVAAMAKTVFAGEGSEKTVGTVVDTIMKRVSEKDVETRKTRDEAKATREEAAAAKPAETARKRIEEENKKRRGELEKAIEESPIDERAAVLSGRIMGGLGSTGLRPLGQAKRQAIVAQEIAKQIQAGQPDMAKDDIRAISQSMARTADRTATNQLMIAGNLNELINRMNSAEAKLADATTVLSGMTRRSRTQQFTKDR
jgi:hypothetical protein